MKKMKNGKKSLLLIKNQLRTDRNDSELKKFGLSLGIFILILFDFVIPVMIKKNYTFPKIPLLTGLVLIIIALSVPKLLYWPQIFWNKLGEVLGFINSRLILGFFFFVILSPMAVIKRLFSKQTENQNSYRITSEYKHSKSLERTF